jgi:alkylhydroperoxidase/carboxymuconolactone decarboxylase family protein YurZ
MHPDRERHYMETLGNIPAPIAAMFDMDDGFGDAYSDLRELIYTERSDGLSTAMKELLMVTFDIVANNLDGALNHLAAARRAGLTDTQLREALLEVFLIFGVSSWGRVGHKVWEAR